MNSQLFQLVKAAVKFDVNDCPDENTCQHLQAIYERDHHRSLSLPALLPLSDDDTTARPFETLSFSEPSSQLVLNPIHTSLLSIVESPTSEEHNENVSSHSESHSESEHSPTEKEIPVNLEEKNKRACEMIAKTFDLVPEDVTRFFGEYPCYLIRNVLCKGYMYVTDRYVCFYSIIPRTNLESIEQTGFMAKKSRRRKQFVTYWFVLKGSVLSWYSNPQDIYYPVSNIDLKTVSSVVSAGPTTFKVSTLSKTYTFQTTSPQALKEWIKSLNEVVFRCKFDGEEVKIVLPMQNITAADLSSRWDEDGEDSNEQQTNTRMSFDGHEPDGILLKVAEVEDGKKSSDEYYFAYFRDTLRVYNEIRLLIPASSESDAPDDSPTELISHRTGISVTSPIKNLPIIRKLTHRRSNSDLTNSASPQIVVTVTSPTTAQPVARPPIDMNMLPPYPPTTDSAVNVTPHHQETVPSPSDTQNVSDPSTAPSILSTSVPKATTTWWPISGRGHKKTSSLDISATTNSPNNDFKDHLTDSASLPRSSSSEATSQNPSSQSWWPRRPPRKMPSIDFRLTKSFNKSFNSSSSNPSSSASLNSSTNASSSNPVILPSQSPTEPLSPTSPTTPSHSVSLEPKNEEFRKTFSLPANETVKAEATAYLVKFIPRIGKIYVSDGFLCFRGTVVGIRTKAKIPLSSIRKTSLESTVFYYGLLVQTKDQNDIYFEFHTFEARKRIFDALNHQMLLLSLSPGSTDNEDFVDTTSESEGGTSEYNVFDQSFGEVVNGENSENEEDKNNDDSTESQTNGNKRPKLGKRRPKGLTGDRLRKHSSILHEIHSKDKHFKPKLSKTQIETLPQLLSPTEVVSIPPLPPMHITILTIGTRGDVQPFIALSKGLMKHGHKCRIATHKEYQDWIEGHGIEFREVKGDPAEIMRLCVDNGMFTVSFIREVFQKFRGWLDELLESSYYACQGTNLLIESCSAMNAGYHIAEKLGIPLFRSMFMPWTRTRFYPHPFAVQEISMGPGYNYMSYTLDQLIWLASRHIVNKWRKNILQLPSLGPLAFDPSDIPFLYGFSRHVVVPPSDWSDWVHTCGYWFLDNPDLKWTPPQSLLDFLAVDPKKTVYIGFGSIVVPDPDLLTRTVVSAVEKAGVRAILSKGWSDRHSASKKQSPSDAVQESYPDCIYPLKSVPHDWLFKRVAGVVHHGGSGTVAAGIRAGVPTVVSPFFGDQYFWASRLQELGAGVWLKKLTVDKLSAALTQITSDDKMIEKAKVLGEKVRNENGVQNAIQNIYRDYHIARQVIKSLQTQHQQQNQQNLPTPNESYPPGLPTSQLDGMPIQHEEIQMVELNITNNRPDDDNKVGEISEVSKLEEVEKESQPAVTSTSPLSLLSSSWGRPKIKTRSRSGSKGSSPGLGPL
ncbi:hypothetical protein BKA69DRAFT_1084373 [Paraphysoderma sedebokerense]|nr:hypothetical protein BKA69DRAFT_1084373 [Paraphysoderma sedebokerense]